MKGYILKDPTILKQHRFKIGNADEVLGKSKFRYKNHFETQRIEHAFLEKEAAIARPDGNGGIELFSQGQGVYEDSRQVALILGFT